jgi:hypothetical protein
MLEFSSQIQNQKLADNNLHPPPQNFDYVTARSRIVCIHTTTWQSMVRSSQLYLNDQPSYRQRNSYVIRCMDGCYSDPFFTRY